MLVFLVKTNRESTWAKQRKHLRQRKTKKITCGIDANRERTCGNNSKQTNQLRQRNEQQKRKRLRRRNKENEIYSAKKQIKHLGYGLVLVTRVWQRWGCIEKNIGNSCFCFMCTVSSLRYWKKRVNIEMQSAFGTCKDTFLFCLNSTDLYWSTGFGPETPPPDHKSAFTTHRWEKQTWLLFSTGFQPQLGPVFNMNRI